jgi:hypothetical protein
MEHHFSWIFRRLEKKNIEYYLTQGANNVCRRPRGRRDDDPILRIECDPGMGKRAMDGELINTIPGERGSEATKKGTR